MSEDVRIDEIKERSIKTLGMMLDYLGLDANLRADQRGGNLVISITSENTGRIIGRKGQTLDSLQLLLNRIIFRGEEDGPRLMLDVDGYTRGGLKEGKNGNSTSPSGSRRRRDGNSDDVDRSEDHKEKLVRQALDAAKEVKRWGDPITLPAMNSHDRRIIHVTLQEDPEIDTNSDGDGTMKKVVISLKKAE